MNPKELVFLKYEMISDSKIQFFPILSIQKIRFLYFNNKVNILESPYRRHSINYSKLMDFSGKKTNII